MDQIEKLRKKLEKTLNEAKKSEYVKKAENFSQKTMKTTKEYAESGLNSAKVQ